MKLSIIIPTYNNFDFLKCTYDSIIKNSKYQHEIIFHINDGSDGTLAFAKKNKIFYTYSPKNIGLCKAANLAASKSNTNLILYSHDDMFFCKDWDIFLEKEVIKYKDNLFYLTSVNVSVNKGLINHDCGSSPSEFNENKFNEFCDNDDTFDLQGSHWAPHLIHKDLWNKVGGFSEEFNPGDGSDPDLCMKLWKENVRIFKAISKFKIYHFSSVTTRKKNIELNNGTKTFLLKYGFNPRYFRKYFLRGDGHKEFLGKLSNPRYDLKMIFELLINKLKYIYFKIF